MRAALAGLLLTGAVTAGYAQVLRESATADLGFRLDEPSGISTPWSEPQKAESVQPTVFLRSEDEREEEKRKLAGESEEDGQLVGFRQTPKAGAVPEPGTMLALGVGAAAFWARRRKKASKA